MSDTEIESAYSALDVCNIALKKLGEPPISGIDPLEYMASRLCYTHYHPTRRELLVKKSWKFALKSVEIESSSDIHCLPDDCLRIMNVSSEKWHLSGRNIICEDRKISVDYISDVEDVTEFSKEFIECFTSLLASKFVIPLLGSITTKEKFLENVEELLKNID